MSDESLPDEESSSSSSKLVRGTTTQELPLEIVFKTTDGLNRNPNKDFAAQPQEEQGNLLLGHSQTEIIRIEIEGETEAETVGNAAVVEGSDFLRNENVQNQIENESDYQPGGDIIENNKINELNQLSTSPSSTSSSSLVDLDSEYPKDGDAFIALAPEVMTTESQKNVANSNCVSSKTTPIPNSVDAKEIQVEIEKEKGSAEKNKEDDRNLINIKNSEKEVSSSVVSGVVVPEAVMLTEIIGASSGVRAELGAASDIGVDVCNGVVGADRNTEIETEPLPIFDYSVSDFGGPWSCTTCTYLNFSNGPACFQCNAQKEKVHFNFDTDTTIATRQSECLESSDREQLSSALKPLKISDYECLSSPLNNSTILINNTKSATTINSAPNSGRKDPPIYFPPSSPPAVPPRPTSTITPKSTIRTAPIPINGSSRFCDGTGSSHIKQQQQQYTHNNFSSTISTSYDEYWMDTPALSTNESDDKWACPMCTFENWPASTKCSMCLTLREVVYNSSNIQQDSSNNNSEIIENNRVLSESMANSSYTQRLRNRKFEADTRWLEACRGVVSGNGAPIEEFLARGGDPTRQLTSSEVAILNRPSAFDVGYTLVHLALRFQHQETLAMLLSHLDCSNSSSVVVKRVPSYVAPDLDQDIRNHVMNTIRYGKGNFRCNFSSEIATFTLPSGILELSPDTQETLYDEILDRDVQKELESGQFINWSSELTVQLNSRLYALWNRSAGDCLLDSVLQATWGIFDKDNRLRQSLANSLRESASLFYQRWRENEILLSHMLDFSLDETQCATDWDNLLSVAGQPGSSLEQLHIFALAHIFRRPIIVYSVKFVKSYLGETLGYARYEGVYLPLLWDSSLCWKWPIALGYTRGHFSALVPQEPHSDPLARVASASQLDGDGMSSRCTYLPLNTADGNLLPIHFLSQAEVGNEEMILSQWLDLSYTNSGVLVARQRIQKRPLLVAQLVEEWLNHYRTLGQMGSTPYMRQSTATCYSSDGDSDND